MERCRVLTYNCQLGTVTTSPSESVGAVNLALICMELLSVKLSINRSENKEKLPNIRPSLQH